VVFDQAPEQKWGGEGRRQKETDDKKGFPDADQADEKGRQSKPGASKARDGKFYVREGVEVAMPACGHNMYQQGRTDLRNAGIATSNSARRNWKCSCRGILDGGGATHQRGLDRLQWRRSRGVFSFQQHALDPRLVEQPCKASVRQQQKTLPTASGCSDDVTSWREPGDDDVVSDVGIG